MYLCSLYRMYDRIFLAKFEEPRINKSKEKVIDKMIECQLIMMRRMIWFER
jgi:hypothetical protein